jgi:hypothetical protein
MHFFSALLSESIWKECHNASFFDSRREHLLKFEAHTGIIPRCDTSITREILLEEFYIFVIDVSDAS